MEPKEGNQKKKIKTTQNPDWMNGINGSSEPFHAMILLFYLFDGYLMINMCCSTMCFFHFRIIQCANHLNTYMNVSEFALMYTVQSLRHFTLQPMRSINSSAAYELILIL